jgi:hypothetical protein
LLTALVMAVTLAIAVGSFAILVTSHNKGVSRSLAWNQSIPLAECGVEEALTQLYYTGTNTPGNGWTVTNGTFFKKRSVGTDGNYYTVSILVSNKPVITAMGYTLKPLSKTAYDVRTVQVRAAKAPAPRGGIVAKGAVTIAGGSFVDSFDSADPNYSTNGQYIASRRKDNGQITSNSGILGAITLGGGGNANAGGVYGYLVTGPLGTVVTTGNESVGDLAYITSGTLGVEAGHVANNANVDFPAVTAPSTAGSYTPSSGAYGGTNYTYLMQNGSYYAPFSVSLANSDTIAVVGDVTLYINGSLSATANSSVYLAPGATLKLYINGSFSVGGKGIINTSQDASRLTVYGVNTLPQTWSYAGQSAFYGTVYAPNANFSFSGGAGAVGQFTGNTVSISGGASVHYDEALAKAVKGWTVTSWNEI